MHTSSNLRACITALLADEQRGCNESHLDNLLARAAEAMNQTEKKVETAPAWFAFDTTLCDYRDKVLECGVVYVRAVNGYNAQDAARAHVESTWSRYEFGECQRIDLDSLSPPDETLAMFNRPEFVFTVGEEEVPTQSEIDADSEKDGTAEFPN